jgi:hypothetical protein
MTSLLINCGAVLALVLAQAWPAAADGSRVLFRDGFDGTANAPTGLTEACSINEMPPSLKSLAFRPLDNKASDVYRSLFILPREARGCVHYEFNFRFMFPTGSRNALTLNLVSGSAEDRKSQSVTAIVVSDKAMTIRTPDAGLLPPFPGTAQDMDIRPMAPNLWHQAKVRVCGTTVELFVENDGILRKFAQAERREAPLAGFNFNGATSFSLDDLEIRKLDPLAGDATGFLNVGGDRVATRAAVYTIGIPATENALEASFKVGVFPGVMQIAIQYASGTQRVVDVKTFGARYDKAVLRAVNDLDKDGRLTPTNRWIKEALFLPDAGLAFRERGAKDAWNVSLNLKPNIRYRYTAEQELAIVSQWDRFPSASGSFVRFALTAGAQGAGIWLNGRFAGQLDSTERVASVSFTVPAGAVLRNVVTKKGTMSTRYLPLDTAVIANPGAMRDATLGGGVKPGDTTVQGVPFKVVDGPRNADTGVCREGLGSIYLECDGYLSRTPFDGMPESLLFGVPVALYNKAWALCAVEDDPDKVPVITARLTKFRPQSEAGRGYAIADTEVVLPRPGEPLPKNVRKVGEVKTGGKTLPLYLVEFRMDVGYIQEIVFVEKPAWLDFEVLGKRNDGDNFYVDRSRKPSDRISGVHVFGLTLERAPVDMHVQSGSFGNFFLPGEKPAMAVTLRAHEKAACTLAWVVRDIAGKVLEQGGRDVAFARAGLEQRVDVAFARTEPGWYEVVFSLKDGEGAEWLRHDASFALLDKDTRQAGYESPYFAWNFGGPHLTITNIAEVGRLLLNAGIRHTHVENETVGEPWKLTMGQLPRLGPKSKDPVEADLEMKKLIEDKLARFPHATMALIFHESGGGPFPLELLGGKTEVDEKQAAYDKAKVEQAVLIAKAYRKYAPRIRLVVGNSGTATPGLLASLFRAGFPREYLDFIGEESVGMTMPPELSVARENWVLRETARVFGYGDVPISACYEWKCRRSRNLGLQRYAEWNVRDILIGLAWRQPLIPTCGLPDVGSSYYNTVWGDEAFTPYPQIYPKPSYPAVSTATRVLDGVRFSRMLPTGSRTVYALEFKRGAEFVYAFWTARGELDMTLNLETDAACRLTELLGKSEPVKSVAGALKIRVGEGAVYLTSPVAVKAVAVLGERQFPREQPPAVMAVANAMDKPDDWLVSTGVDSRIDIPARLPVGGVSFRRPGIYELRGVTDDVKGACLEMELTGTNACPALMQEYAFLKLRQPIALSGRPATIGLWVKGNSSWGKLFWEIEDAEGERWLSAGSGGYGCDVYDWPELAGLNFDGWHFLQFPITSLSPVKVASPGQDGLQWQHDGTGNRMIDYPVKATGVAVSMPRQALNLLDMEPVRTVIRLKSLSAY